MLDIIMSHWMTYVYVVYVLVLVVLSVAYRPRISILSWRPRRFRPRLRIIVPGVRMRQSR